MKKGVRRLKPPVVVAIDAPAGGLPQVFTDREHMLCAGDAIQLVHYRQKKNTEKTSLRLHTNILSYVIQGRKQVYHPGCKLEILPWEGFFLAKGNYLTTERCFDEELGYESLIIFLSDPFLASLDNGKERAPSPASRGGAGTPAQALRLYKDGLVTTLLQQFLQYFDRLDEKHRIEPLLPLKIRELMDLLCSSEQNKGIGAVIGSLPLRKEEPLSLLMETHFRERLSMEQWAFLAGCSLASFKRRFEALYQMPPGRWIRERKLEEAWRLLSDAALNVTEVCYEVGFESPAHFIQAFREKYGITPKQRQLQPDSYQ